MLFTKTYSAIIIESDVIKISSNDSQVYMRITENTSNGDKYSIVILPEYDKLAIVIKLYKQKLNERIAKLHEKRQHNPKLYNASYTNSIRKNRNTAMKELKTNILRHNLNKLSSELKNSPSISDQDIINAINIYYKTPINITNLNTALTTIKYKLTPDEIKERKNTEGKENTEETITITDFFKKCEKQIKPSFFSLAPDLPTLIKLKENYEKHIKIIDDIKEHLLSFITETINLTIDIFFKFNTHLREYKISIINYIKDVKKIIADNHNITHIKHSESEYIDNKYEIVKTYITYITKIEQKIEQLILSDSHLTNTLATMSMSSSKIINNYNESFKNNKQLQ